MQILLIVPAVLSALVLAAHFLRAGSLPLTVLSLALPLLLIPRATVFLRVLEFFLLLAAFEWALTLKAIVDDRIAAGQPWHRSAYILGGVAAFNILSAVLLEFAARVRRRRTGNTASITG